MGESQARRFLERNRSAVVNGVREVKRLVDFLIEKKYLLGEMPHEILSKNTRQDQMRELYTHLNADRGYELVLTWLTENEPDLIKDLVTDLYLPQTVKNSNTDHGEPARKRARGSEEAVDQPDSQLSIPNLQSFSTLPKLEKWVSDSKISEDLIGALNTKLAEGEMESLEKQLKDKKLKKGLCFSASDVKDINSNQKLQSFFDTCKDAKFPDLPIKLFFEKDRGQATGESKTEKDDERRLDEDVFSDVVTDSALGSSCSSSYSSNQSLFRKHSSQTTDLSASYGGSELTDSSYNVRTTTEDQTQNINVLLTAPPPTALGVAGDSPRQGKGPLQNPDPDPHATFREKDMQSAKESRGVFSKQGQELPDTHCVIRSPVQMQHTDKDGTALEEAMDMEDMEFMPSIKSARELLTYKPCAAEPLPPPFLGVAADGPLLEKPLDLLESEGTMQCDPEVANSEPLFEQVVESIMQVPQTNHDRGLFTEHESTELASQKECMEFDIPKQRLPELPESYNQNRFHVQVQNQNKDDTQLQEFTNANEKPHMLPQTSDDTPLEQPLVVQERGPNMPLDSRPIKYGGLIAESFQFSTLKEPTVDPMQSKDPGCTQEIRDSHSVTVREKPIDLKESKYVNMQCEAEVVKNETHDKYGHKGVVVDSLMQSGVSQMVHDPDPFTEFKETLLASKKEQRGSDISKQSQKLPEACCQNKETGDKDDAPLQKTMDIQQTLLEPHIFPPTSNVLKQAKDLQDCKDDAPLEQFLSVQESELNMQHDSKRIKYDSRTAESFQSATLEAATDNHGLSADIGCTPKKKDSHPTPMGEKTNMPPQKSISPNQTNDLFVALRPNGTGISLEKPLDPQKDEAARQCDSEVANNKVLVEHDHKGLEVDSIMQKEVAQMVCDPDLLTEFEDTHLASQKVFRGSDISEPKQGLPEANCQNRSHAQMQHLDKDDEPLQAAMDFQEDGFELYGSPQTSNVSKQAEHLQVALCERLDRKDDTRLRKTSHSTNGKSNVSDPDCLNVAKYSVESKGSHLHSKDISEADIVIHDKNTDMPLMNASLVLHGQDGNGTGLTFISTDSEKTAEKTKRRQQQNSRKLSKINDQRRLLYEWAKRRCSSGSEEELKKVLDCISIENQVEHREYPCFAAENVMVYADPRTGDKHIIVIDEKNNASKKTIPKETRVLLNYQMWVCGVQKAVLVNQDDRVVQLDEAFIKAIRNKCERFVFEALAPALAVFKNMQRQERLYSLISNH
ncbi:hypothetical protein NFI96_021990 [Prochilodus magdalenae]|nr:hypothetical protein NFI96_021990 [Prochilodus magdalenae]